MQITGNFDRNFGLFLKYSKPIMRMAAKRFTYEFLALFKRNLDCFNTAMRARSKKAASNNYQKLFKYYNNAVLLCSMNKKIQKLCSLKEVDDQLDLCIKLTIQFREIKESVDELSGKVDKSLRCVDKEDIIYGDVLEDD